MIADDVFTWLMTLPSWQQDLARRLADRVELADDEYDTALLAILAAFGVTVDRDVPVAPITREQIEERSDNPPARLLRLGSLKNVGLVSPAEEIRFAPTGLTVVYGANASGKSSYVRAVKRLARTVDTGCRVRSNVFDPASGEPSAKIEFELGGETVARRTSLGDDPDVRLIGLSVFDSACAELYVNAQNDVEYVPVELRLLARLAATQDRLRKDLSVRISELQATEPCTDDFAAGTTVAAVLAGLTGGDDDPDLRSLATLSPDEEGRRTALRAVVAAAQASTAANDAAAARRDAKEATELATTIDALLATVSAESAATLCRLAAEAGCAAATADLAARTLSDEGVGTEPWRRLWEAARAFVAETETAFPPVAGDVCPLCRQEVTSGAAERLAHFDAHVSSSVQSAAEATDAALRTALADIDPDRVSACRKGLLPSLAERESGLVSELEALLTALETHLTAMRATPASAVALEISTKPVTRLRAWGARRDTHADDLIASADPGTFAQSVAELAELDARARLHQRLATFETWRSTLAEVAALTTARSALTTTKITTAQRKIADKAVSKALREAVDRERKLLDCMHLPVKLATKADHAETKASLKLLSMQTAKLGDIVSDGERRALALCFYFAELTVADDDGGIVLDDPVSSLDEDRRQYIAHRLVAEAAHRQVIVFTHDLPLVMELQTQAQDAGREITVQGIWRQGDLVGRVDGHPPARVLKLKERIGLLRDRVAKWDSQPAPANEDEAWHRVTAFYADLRTAWERAVEERLLKGCIQRFGREVHTTPLGRIEITPDLVAEVEEGMTRTSMFVHDQPSRSALALPGRTDLAKDLKLLDEFAGKVKT